MTIKTAIPASPEVTEHEQTEAMFNEFLMVHINKNVDKFHEFIENLRPISRLRPERSLR